MYHDLIDFGQLVAEEFVQYAQSLGIEKRLDALLALVAEGGRSSRELAVALGVSVPTVARDLRALRERGHSIAAKRDGRGWQYLLDDEDDLRMINHSDQRPKRVGPRHTTGSAR